MKEAKVEKMDCERAEKTSNQTSQSCGCGDGRVCDDISSKTCSTKECKPLVIPNAKILGNMNFIGTKRIVFCNDYAFEVNGNKKIECKTDGSWKPNIECRNKTIAMHCANDSDCAETNATCIRENTTAATGRCFCHHLFTYDEKTGNCVQECTSMSDTFTIHNNTIIRFYNIIELKDLASDVVKCQQECVGNPLCLSFDFIQDRKCNLNNVTMEMISLVDKGFLENTPGATLYSRDCNKRTD